MSFKSKQTPNCILHGIADFCGIFEGSISLTHDEPPDKNPLRLLKSLLVAISRARAIQQAAEDNSNDTKKRHSPSDRGNSFSRTITEFRMMIYRKICIPVAANSLTLFFPLRIDHSILVRNAYLKAIDRERDLAISRVQTLRFPTADIVRCSYLLTRL